MTGALVADAMALGCALAWAIALVLFQRIRGVSAVALNLFKNAVATVLLLATMLIFRLPFQTDRSVGDWLILAASGVLGLVVADTLFFSGLARLDASVAAICDCAYAPTVFLLSVIFLGERPSVAVFLGAPLVVLGLFFATASAPRGDRPVDRVGVLLLVSGVASTAAGVVLAKAVLARSELVEATAVRLIVGTVVLFAVELARGRLGPALALFRPQPIWRHALPATFFGTYVAMILWLGGMRAGMASRTALLNQLGAIFALGLARLGGEKVPPRRWFGAALAVVGAGVVLLAR